MKLSELIERLQRVEKKYGNLDVIIFQRSRRLKRELSSFYITYNKYDDDTEEVHLQDLPY